MVPTTQAEAKPKRVFTIAQKAKRTLNLSKYRLKQKEKKGKYRSTDGVMSARVKTFATSTTTELDRLVRSITKNANLHQWKDRILERVRVATSILAVLPHPQSMSECNATQRTIIKPSDELSRAFVIQLREKKEWVDLFEIKQSTIEGSGYGIFACRPFPTHCTLGIYYGDLIQEGEETAENSIYAMSAKWKFNRRSKKETSVVVDPLSGVGSMGDMTNAFFGLHMVNDPNWVGLKGKAGTKRGTRNFSPNMMVCDDLVAYATSNIAKGEELFLDYQMVNPE
jgi:hypothetical protein